MPRLKVSIANQRTASLLRVFLCLAILALGLNLGWRGLEARGRSRQARGAFDLAPNEMKPVYQWNTGDTLPDIPVRLVSLYGRSDGLHLSAILDKCTILIFFQSGCRACKTLATFWSDRSHLTAGGQEIVVRWVSVTPSDPAASEFMISHKLPWPYLEAVRAKDIVDLGVTQWPTIYVVSQGNVLVRKPRLLPEEILERRGGCSAWLAGSDPHIADAGT